MTLTAGPAVKNLEISLVVPDLWQQEAVRAIREGRDVVIDAPTGSGKTYIFDLLYPTLKPQAVFTVPTRALANDKLAEWQALGRDVGIVTGDLAWRPEARVIVATLETQKGKLLRQTGPRLLVVDEYQMIADPVRGLNYELALALAPPDTQLLLLSGSVSNPGDVADWLQRLGRDVLLVSHRERPVPIEEVDLENLPGPMPGNIRGFWPRAISRALRLNLGPVLVFAPRRRAAEDLAREIASALPPDPLTLSQEQETLAGPALAKLLRQRVSFHHSGLGYALRAGLIEPLAKNGHLRVIVATMGLAAGINFSVRSVLVTDTRYMHGPFEKQVEPDELLQMFGRAGRRGMDEVGYVLTTSRHPRLHDARARQLRRPREVDWPTLIAVMTAASDRKHDPMEAALKLKTRLFSTHPVPLGIEHSFATGQMPCALGVDMERARFIRRGTVEMLNSRGEWEPKSPRTMSTLGEARIRLGERWRPALSQPSTLAQIRIGVLCKLRTPGERTYGREAPLASIDSRDPSRLRLTKGFRKHFPPGRFTRSRLESEVLSRLPEWSEGGQLQELVERGPMLVARLDYSSVRVPVHVDSHGVALSEPETRTITPTCCENCTERNWCLAVEIRPAPADAWRVLGLIDSDGRPTRRGRIFGFFNHGEGLAVAAALENADYPIDDLVFDLANLRAGHRFAGEDSPLGGRLGILCQETYQRADYSGYLELGVPVNYGAGAAEIVRSVVQNSIPRHRLLTENLRPGDIERAIAEWRSLLRHIASAPDDEWDRWKALKTAAIQIAAREAAAPPVLPPLLAAQMQKRSSPASRLE